MIVSLVSEQRLEITSELLPYISSDSPAPDITVAVSWDWQEAEILSAEPIGRDQLLIYRTDGNRFFCELDGGALGSFSQTQYTPDFSSVKCVVNTKNCRVPQNTVRQILRMLPIRQMFLQKYILFLHASQILYRNRSIVFSAPSGTGKTTQAKLWCHYRNAEILCNDRTLFRKTAEKWQTYRFPNDGSEPVSTNKTGSPCCIVLLEQAPVNRIERLPPRHALASMIPQVVYDSWNTDSYVRAVELLIAVYRDLPVYRFCCTADETAVETLENILLKEGILSGTGI